MIDNHRITQNFLQMGKWSNPTTFILARVGQISHVRLQYDGNMVQDGTKSKSDARSKIQKCEEKRNRGNNESKESHEKTRETIFPNNPKAVINYTF